MIYYIKDETGEPIEICKTRAEAEHFIADAPELRIVPEPKLNWSDLEHYVKI